MASWQDLWAELDIWRDKGQRPTLWWRDDDTTAPTDALDRLLDLARRNDIPMHLSVIPKGARPDLAERLSAAHDVWVLQHGWAHINHEPKGQGASEMGESRSIAQQHADLQAGWDRLQALQMPGLLPGFAAPWNRVSGQTPALLRALGFRVLSTNYARTEAEPVPGLLQVNVHADPIRWKIGAAFRGEARFLACVVDHLVDRRLGRADPAEPTGITTHHLQTSDEIWAFLDLFVARITPHVTWLRMADLLEHSA